MSVEQDSILTALGDSAVRFARPKAKSAAALLPFLTAVDGVLDVVLSESEIAVYFDPAHPPRKLRDLPKLCRELPDRSTTGRKHCIEVRYSGPDLAVVAEHNGLSVAEVIQRHSQREYVVSMLGFLPGFAYLQGLDSTLCTPRRESPRKQVPKHALAIGGAYTAIYPCASPGGWNLIGEALEPELFGRHGARLQAGDRVIFSAVA